MLPLSPADPPVVLRRAESPRGELVLRARTSSDGAVVHELIVNGAFAMDSQEVASELRLAQLVVEQGRLGRVAVGGLGLGFTAAALLDADVRHLDVVELEADLVFWAREGVTEQLRRVAADPRCTLHTADVVPWLDTAPEGAFDAVLLDVDNGPDFLIHDSNQRLYRSGVLARALSLVRPEGVLAVWCQHRTPSLERTLTDLGPTTEELVRVQRGRHQIDYAIYLTRHPRGA
ncbi:spermidine synthase family protein [Auraticoccus monumenti]|uniref:Spermidine synthase n=1 Tax=Auraticoccus monumenti TaxID=675864 RepID=A0A1G6ZU53_9ACTN|nr:hypothetical protein [Auraticoccus monumenti]SDE06079.1 hypothetical protein SAMN04489747_2401 [Auraticoccus monumenti]